MNNRVFPHCQGLNKRASVRHMTAMVVFIAVPLVCTAQDDEERLYWESIRCHEEKEVRLYLEEFPRGVYVDQAIECLRDIARSRDDGDSEQGGDDAAEADSADQIADRLAQCQAHLEADRLTSGEGGTALECYQAVFAMDADNAEALAGLKRIEDTYAKWARSAVEAGDAARAERNLDKLERLNPGHAAILELRGALAELDKQPAREPLEPEMVRVNGGCFQMGSPADEAGPFDNERQHRVCVEDFSMGKYEVTQGQWQAVMGDNPSTFQGEDRPVEQVSWHDVQDYIDQLNARTGKDYRLPTEAEWEYACRSGGASQRYCGGDDVDGLAWSASNSGEKHPVGRKRANGLGLYDMSGNVREWTCSTYSHSYDGRETRCASKTAGGDRVLRGGSYIDLPRNVRSAARDRNDPDYRNGNVGFRLAQD